jgi:hypothetical protein
MGVAPQLTMEYGMWDNGKYVFDSYDNFAGNTLSNMWTKFIGYHGSWSIKVNNGPRISGSSTTSGTGQSAQIHTASKTPELISEADLDNTSLTGNAAAGTGFETMKPATSGSDGGFVTAYRYDYFAESNVYRILGDVKGAYDGITVTENAGSGDNGITTASWPATGTENLQFAYANSLSDADSDISKVSSFQYLYLGSSSISASTIGFQWFRTRQSPPNGVPLNLAELPLWTISAGYDQIATSWYGGTSGPYEIYQNTWDNLILQFTAFYGLPNPMAIKAQIHQETSFNLTAVSSDIPPCNPNSSGTPPYGLMQNTPDCDMIFGVVSADTANTQGLPGGGSSCPGTIGTCTSFTYYNTGLGRADTDYVNEVTSSSSVYYTTSVFNPVYALNEGISIMGRWYSNYLTAGCSGDSAYKMALSYYNDGPNSVNPSTCTYTDTAYVNNVIGAYNALVANSVTSWTQQFP